MSSRKNPPTPAVPIEHLMGLCGIDPAAPFEVGPFPSEMRRHPSTLVEPEPVSDDPLRVEFTLDAEQALKLKLVATYGSGDDRNAWWSAAGNEIGFVWTTVENLAFTYETGPDQQLNGATFTAVGTAIVQPLDQEALDWLARHDPNDGGGVIGETDELAEFTREVVLSAFVAGRDHGFAMGATAAELHQARTRVMEGMVADALELLAVARGKLRACAENDRNDAAKESSDAADRELYLATARSSDAIADRIATFMDDPSAQRLAHDGLREAREDAANGVIAGFTAGVAAARTAIERAADDSKADGAWIDERARRELLPLLDLLPAPDDMDEALNPWRGVGAQLLRLRTAAWTTRDGSNEDLLVWAVSVTESWYEWQRKTDWIMEAFNRNLLPDDVRMTGWGRHRADVLRALVDWQNGALQTTLQAVAGLQGAIGQACDLAEQIAGDPSPGLMNNERAEITALRTLARPLVVSPGFDPEVLSALRQTYEGGK